MKIRKKQEKFEGEIRVSKFNNTYGLIKFENENDFNKKQGALKKYLQKSWKYLEFQVIPKLKKEHKKGGEYEVDLLGDQLFNQVYGNLKLLFRVEDDVAILEDIIPNDIILEMHRRELPTYKGIPYRDNKDLFKIKMLEEKENDRKDDK